MSTCQSCGFDNPGGGMHCVNCGADMPTTFARALDDALQPSLPPNFGFPAAPPASPAALSPYAPSAPAPNPYAPPGSPAGAGTTICPTCGRRNEQHYHFCLGCAADLRAAPSAPAPNPYAPADSPAGAGAGSSLASPGALPARFAAARPARFFPAKYAPVVGLAVAACVASVALSNYLNADLGSWIPLVAAGGALNRDPLPLILNAVVAVVAVTIAIERFAFQMGKYGVNSREFFAQIKKLLVNGNIDRALKLCGAADFPILQLVKAGLTHANQGTNDIDAALAEKISELRPAVEARIPVLLLLTSLAMLIGLVGTARGVNNAFASVSAAQLSAAARQAILKDMISKALPSTFFGLFIGAICMVAYFILHSRSKAIIQDLASTSERVFRLLAEGAQEEHERPTSQIAE